jgi:hypothetical protein
MAAAGYQLHKRQLFHWIGREVNRQNKGRKTLDDALVKKCLDYVRGSLESGLWVKSPGVPEKFTLDGNSLALTMPITCFTEWSLGESLNHTQNYGQIGFGFPKRWVIERGGQSVTYFRHAKKSSFLRGIFQLLKSVATPAPDGLWNPKTPKSGLDELLYLLHFMKVIREPAAQRAKARRVVPKIKTSRPLKPVKVPIANYRRRFGAGLPFVEEREWRVVYHQSNPCFAKGPGVPEYFLPYLPGDEMFTLVLPDNKVVSALLQNDWFTQRLFTPWKVYSKLNGRVVPPVTVLAFSDVGTF